MLHVKDALRREITGGKFQGKDRLPGIRELAHKYACSPGTAANAVRSLCGEGLLRTEHGRGTFLTHSGKVPPRRDSRVIGAILLRNSWMEAMESLRGEYLAQGWFVSAYCSSDDLQNPAAERRFLELAAKQNFAGVMLVGTPLEPWNTDYYFQLRRSGMKIIHLAHYKMDMTGEAAILPDYRMAGALACSTAALRGKKRIAVLRSAAYRPPSSLLRGGGVEAMAHALHLELLPDFPMEKDGSVFSFPAGKWKDFSRKYGPVTDLALLADSCRIAVCFREFLSIQGIPEGKQPFLLAMSDTDEEKKSISHIAFNYRQSIRMAMEYLSSDTIAPLEPFRQTLAPELCLTPSRKEN